MVVFLQAYQNQISSAPNQRHQTQGQKQRNGKKTNDGEVEDRYDLIQDAAKHINHGFFVLQQLAGHLNGSGEMLIIHYIIPTGYEVEHSGHPAVFIRRQRDNPIIHSNTNLGGTRFRFDLSFQLDGSCENGDSVERNVPSSCTGYMGGVSSAERIALRLPFTNQLVIL